MDSVRFSLWSRRCLGLENILVLLGQVGNMFLPTFSINIVWGVVKCIWPVIFIVIVLRSRGTAFILTSWYSTKNRLLSCEVGNVLLVNVIVKWLRTVTILLYSALVCRVSRTLLTVLRAVYRCIICRGSRLLVARKAHTVAVKV